MRSCTIVTSSLAIFGILVAGGCAVRAASAPKPIIIDSIPPAPVLGEHVTVTVAGIPEGPRGVLVGLTEDWLILENSGSVQRYLEYISRERVAYVLQIQQLIADSEVGQTPAGSEMGSEAGTTLAEP